jgi:hypothetical protein
MHFESTWRPIRLQIITSHTPKTNPPRREPRFEPTGLSRNQLREIVLEQLG